MDKDNRFFYELEKVKVNILQDIDALSEFENTFDDRLSRASSNGKSGIFIKENEYLCIVRRYRSIRHSLTAHYQVLIDSAKHEKFQTRLLESSLMLEILSSPEQKKSA